MKRSFVSEHFLQGHLAAKEQFFQDWLKAKLDRVREQFQPLPGLLYRGPADFVLQHGVWYPPRAIPSDVRKGADLMCYGNSIVYAVLRNAKYVEGFAMSPLGDVYPHAWNADCVGALIDTTWMNTGLTHLGVEFSVERADDATWNGDAAVLVDSNRGYPIFRERWQGEDYNLSWPANPRMDLLRQGNQLEALRWAKEHM